MKQATLLVLAAMMALAQAKAEERTIDISGNNTSSDYKSYGTAISPCGRRTEGMVTSTTWRARRSVPIIGAL